LAALMAAAAWSGEKAGGEMSSASIWLVRILEINDNRTFGLVNAADLAAWEAQMALERKLFDRALALAIQAWETDPATADKVFPRSAVNPRSLTRVGTYADLELARAKLKYCQAQEAKRRAAFLRDLADGGKGHKANVREKENKQQRWQQEKQALDDLARDLFQKKLAELQRNAAAAAAPGAAATPAAAE